MSIMTVTALQNADLLRLLQSTPPEQIPTVAALAALIERDESNTRKTLKILSAEDLVAVGTGALRNPYLTDKGQAFLAALARAESDPTSEALPDGYVWLRHDQIRPDPDNARKRTGLSEISIASMAESLLSKGMLQGPGVTATPDEDRPWTLTMGERRYRGWGLNIERGDWPADKLILCKIEDGDPLDRMLKGLVENLQRSDITNLEMGEAFLQLTEQHGQTAQQIAKDVDRTERFVQIAIKVAREATPEDKARYIESEEAYALAKATGGEAKRTFTWEQLRSEVQTPRHKAALAKGDNLVVTLVELAYRAVKENGHGRTWVEIQTPPGGGHWAHAETLGLIEDSREDGKTLARTTDRAEAWLNDQGFYADPDAMLARIRIEAHGEITERIAREEGRYIIGFINPPKPKADPVAVTPAATEQPPEEDRAPLDRATFLRVIVECLTADHDWPHAAATKAAEDALADELETTGKAFGDPGRYWDAKVAMSLADDWAAQYDPPQLAPAPASPPRDSFAEQIRQVNAEAAAESAPPAPTQEQALMRQLVETKKEPGPEDDEAEGPGLTNAEWIALAELAHKINKAGIDLYGGTLICAEVGNYQSGPAASVAQALIHKRMAGFRASLDGATFYAYLTPAARELFDEEVTDGYLDDVHYQSLPANNVAELEASGSRYVTPWLYVEAKPEPAAEAGEAAAPTYEEASADYELVNPTPPPQQPDPTTQRPNAEAKRDFDAKFQAQQWTTFLQTIDLQGREGWISSTTHGDAVVLAELLWSQGTFRQISLGDLYGYIRCWSAE